MKNMLSIKNISKIYYGKEDTLAIKDVSLDVSKHEIVAIVGMSGCGKSTLLNIISGLDKKTSGTIEFSMDNPRISYMLQTDALLPFRNVLDNACLGLELMHEKNDENIDFVKNLLKEYGLMDFINKRPNNLSGGMKQRVALIRSIAIKPDLLLLDEPFSALDYYTRINISNDVFKMIRRFGMTSIIITHDIREAIGFADKIIVLSARPSTVKKVYETGFGDMDIIERNKSEKFNQLYEAIWRDLDEQV